MQVGGKRKYASLAYCKGRDGRGCVGNASFVDI